MSEGRGAIMDWIGRRQDVEDDIALAPALSALATLDDVETVLTAGAPLPPLWHWLYFLPRAPRSLIGVDGHPQRGGFMPPIDLPRRMFAGARLTFHRSLRIGGHALRRGTIRAVQEKAGRSGRLAFVTVHYAVYQDSHLAIEEEQDIVYREPGAPLPAPALQPFPPLPAGAWAETIVPDPVLLFRFSALTFNGHRIHYDRPYAMQAEGYPGLVVHGPLTAILLMELVRRHATRRVTAFEFRGLAPLFDLHPFRVVAQPAGETQIALEAQGPDGRPAMTATATLT